MAMPQAAVDMTDVPQENLNMARNTAARVLPEALQGGAVTGAREMAQVPAANPERRSMGPRADIEQSPYPPQVQARVQRMIQLGAPPQAVVEFLNSAMP